jgi:hypothetical protein
VALAASVAAALGAGIYIGLTVRGGGNSVPAGGEVLLAALQPQARLDRGGPFQTLGQGAPGVYPLKGNADFRVAIQSPRQGFATVVLLAPERLQVYPRPSEADLRVEAFETRNYGPLGAPGDKSVVLVIVTAEPAAETIRESLTAGGATADQVDDVLSGIQRALWKKGLRWAAVGRITVERVAQGE